MNQIIEHIDQITPEWLTSVLEKSGYLDSGKVILVNKIQSLKTGETSQRFHLELACSDDAPKTAPRHLFLKISKPSFSEISRKEVLFYNVPVDIRKDLPVLRCYDAVYSAQTKTSHILLQDLSKTHHEPERLLPPSKTDCENAIECLAELHAFWWNDPRLGNDVGEQVTRDSANQKMKYLEACTARFFDTLGDRLSKERRKVYESVISSYPNLFWKRIEAEEPVTLIHGDAHLSNFMFPNDAGEDGTILLDWQSWQVDFGSDDLAHLMALNWDSETREAMEKDLLLHYLDILKKSGVAGYGWEECWHGYRVSVIRNLFVPILFFESKIPSYVWRFLLENIFQAFQDLHCSELLGT